jgi:DNA modification methylase
VLDPFSGGATTGLACLKTDRRYLGIELNPEYIEMAFARARKYYPLLLAA